MRKWGIDVLSLANNHICDHGWKGLEQTRRVLDEIGVSYLGANENLGAATQPLVLNIRHMKVGVLAYSWEAVETTCATEDSFGCAPLHGELMQNGRRALADRVNAVIVLPHWGCCD